MADYTENQVLNVAVNGTERVEANAKAFLDQESAADRAKKAIYEIAETAEQAAKKTYDLSSSVVVASAKMTQAETEARNLSKALATIKAESDGARVMGIAMERAGVSALGLGRGITGLNQNMTGFSYAMNDFFSVTGGLDQRLISISNNLPMMLAGLGGVGLALSAAVPIAAMVIRNWDSIEALWENTNPAKDAAQSVEELTHALSKDKEALEKLHDKATASNADLAEMARLTKAVAEQEATLEIERAARAVKETPGKEQVGRGALFDKIVKEYGGETVTREIRAILRGFDKGSPAEVIENQTKEYIAALKAGNTKALEHIQTLVAQGYGGDTFTGHALLTGKTMEEESAARMKRVEETNAAVKKREAEEAEAAAKLADDLTRQGQQNQDEFFQGADPAQKRAEAAQKKATTEAKKAQTAEQRAGHDVAAHVSKVSTTDEQAAALAAQIRAQGGVNGRRMNVEQQQKYLEARIFNDLRQKIGAQQAQMASEPLARQAFQKADDAAGVLQGGVAAQGRVGAMGLGNQAKLISVAQMLTLQAQQAAMAQAQQGQAIDRLLRANNGLNARTAAPRGRG